MQPVSLTGTPDRFGSMFFVKGFNPCCRWRTEKPYGIGRFIALHARHLFKNIRTPGCLDSSMDTPGAKYIFQQLKCVLLTFDSVLFIINPTNCVINEEVLVYFRGTTLSLETKEHWSLVDKNSESPSPELSWETHRFFFLMKQLQLSTLKAKG